MNRSTKHGVLGLAALGAAGLFVSAAAHAAGKLDVLYSFCAQAGCPDGDQPYGGVTLDGAHHLIGTTGFGGAYNGGTVFALRQKRHGAKLRTLKSFCTGTPPDCQSDEGPSTTLVEDVGGNIYGTAYFAGSSNDGAAFELEAKGNGRYKLRYLHTFDGSDGAGPNELSYAGQASGARYDGTSPLYGSTVAGGANGSGTVYTLTPGKSGWNFQTIYTFCSAANCTDGGLPRASVIVDPSGALFGTTDYDGADNAGTIYRLAMTNGAWDFSLLYTFCSAAGCSDGNAPFARLAEDGSGNLYGTTYFGGNANDGVVFELAANGKYSVLHSFCSEQGCADGSEPFAAVTLDAAGDLFGTTSRGGDRNYGDVFEVTSAGKFKRVYSFCALNSCADGGYPYGTLALDSAGHIFGTTQYGGAWDLGEVYRLTR
ncbi:MAG: choice-of-anchor tandem repeat GloVer-containing protein [Rhizomicrobium sp.]